VEGLRWLCSCGRGLPEVGVFDIGEPSPGHGEVAARGGAAGEGGCGSEGGEWMNAAVQSPSPFWSQGGCSEHLGRRARTSSSAGNCSAMHGFSRAVRFCAVSKQLTRGMIQKRTSGLKHSSIPVLYGKVNPCPSLEEFLTRCKRCVIFRLTYVFACFVG